MGPASDAGGAVVICVVWLLLAGLGELGIEDELSLTLGLGEGAEGGEEGEGVESLSVRPPTRRRTRPPAAGYPEPQPDLAPPVAGGCAAGVQWRAARAGSPGTGRGERGVRISNVTAYQLPGTRYPWVFLRLETDDGLTGLGQVSSGPNSPPWSPPPPASSARSSSARTPAGSSTSGTSSTPASTRSARSASSPPSSAGWTSPCGTCGARPSASPIFELLGGRFRDRLVLYSNGWFSGCQTPEDFAPRRQRTVDEGHTALKLDPFRHTRWTSQVRHRLRPGRRRRGRPHHGGHPGKRGPRRRHPDRRPRPLRRPHRRPPGQQTRPLPHRLVRGAGTPGELQTPCASSAPAPPCPSASASASTPAGSSGRCWSRSWPSTSCRTSSAPAASASCAGSPLWPRPSSSPSAPRRHRPDHPHRRRPDDDGHGQLLPPGDRLLRAGAYNHALTPPWTSVTATSTSPTAPAWGTTSPRTTCARPSPSPRASSRDGTHLRDCASDPDHPTPAARVRANSPASHASHACPAPITPRGTPAWAGWRSASSRPQGAPRRLGRAARRSVSDRPRSPRSPRSRGVGRQHHHSRPGAPS